MKTLCNIFGHKHFDGKSYVDPCLRCKKSFLDFNKKGRFVLWCKIFGHSLCYRGDWISSFYCRHCHKDRENKYKQNNI